MKQEKKIILASASPRRKALLEELGLDICVKTADIEETPMPCEAPVDFAMRMASEKALSVTTKLSKCEDSYCIISADTIVVIDDLILGKPADDEDAVTMLERLSGRTHSVITAYAVGTSAGNWYVSYAQTKVSFYSLSKKDILEYVATKEPHGKAGAYAIQEKGSLLVSEINGEYSNVVGLPLSCVMRCLLKMKVLKGLFVS